MATPNGDQALLREFVDRRSQSAFAQLVERHAGMVHSAALRQTRDRHLAEDVSQAVFLLLAQRAGTIGPRVVLSGWLYNAARYAGLAARRGSKRRRRHEQKAADPMTSRKQPVDESFEWSEVEPAIDEAIARLREPDRVALILRYFENKSLKEVAAALSVTEDAAKRRCHRGLERLRKLLRVGAPASGIGIALSANAVQAAPAHLVAAASNISLNASPAVSLLAKGALNIMIQAKLKLVAVVAAFLVAIGAAQIAVTRAQTPANAPAKGAPSANAPKRTAADLMPSQVAPGSPRAVFFEAFGAGISGDARKLRSLVLLDADERAIADRAVSAQVAFEKALKEAFPKADTSSDGVLPAPLVRFVAVQMKGLNNLVEDTTGDESTIGKPDGSFKFIFRRINGDWKWDLKHKPELEDDAQFRRATGEARIRLTHMLKKLAPTFEAAAKKVAAKGYASRGEAWSDVRTQSLRAMQENPPELRPQTQPVPPIVAIQTEEYSAVRKSFRTKLLKHGPATAPTPIPPTPADAQLVDYSSGAMHLKSWLFVPTTGPAKRPAVIHLVGGLKLHPDKWANTKLFRDAGFVFMMPTLRSEHGQAGDFTAYYDEVDDVIAAAEYLRSLPSVDPDRIFLVGYGDGGAVALLTAEASNQFRAVAPISAIHDYLLLSKALPPAGYKNLVFDTTNPREFEVRSGFAYLPSLKCPAQIFYGKEEWYFAATADRMVEVGKAHHLDVSATAVPGDSKTATLESLRQALAFFQKHL